MISPTEIPRMLMVAYNFPPINNGGVLRSKMIAKYFVRAGWDIEVLTTDYAGSIPEVYEGAKIVRAPELRSVIKRFRSSRPIVASASVAPEMKAVPKKGVSHFFRRIYRKWLFIPDISITWVVFAIVPAIKHVRRHRDTIVYTTSPPESSHLVGMLLKIAFKTKWVMDLRDPWSFEPIDVYRAEGGVRLSIDTWLEKKCFAKADLVIVNTKNATEKYKEIYPQFYDRFVCITNGYDDEQIESVKSNDYPWPAWLEALRGKVLISHVGTFGRHGETNAVPGEFLRSVRTLLDEGVLNERKHAVVFAGNQSQKTVSSIGNLGLAGFISTPGVVKHDDALKLMSLSSVLYVNDPNPEGQFYVHGKLYEYLAMNKNILAVLPDGASRLLIEGLDRVFLSYPGDYDGLLENLRAALKVSGSDICDLPVDGAAYSYTNLVAKMLREMRRTFCGSTI